MHVGVSVAIHDYYRFTPAETEQDLTDFAAVTGLTVKNNFAFESKLGRYAGYIVEVLYSN